MSSSYVWRKFYRRRSEWVRLAKITDAGSLLRFFSRSVAFIPSIVRDGTTASLAHALNGREVRFDVDGRRVTLPGEHFAGAREIYARRVYEAVPGFEVRPGDVVVDLGANVGVFTLLASAAAERVIAVEAQAGFVEILRRNLARNERAGRVTVVHGLVGAGTGVLAAPDDVARASHGHGAAPTILTLEELLDAHGVSSVGLLKCDIEGSEYALFEDFPRWAHRVERVVMEVHPQYGSTATLVGRFRECGFECSLLTGDLQPTTDSEHAEYLYARRGTD